MSSDTACSSAVVATHLGVQHLEAHGGSVLTAGVNLMLAETTTAAARAAGMVVCTSAANSRMYGKLSWKKSAALST